MRPVDLAWLQACLRDPNGRVTSIVGPAESGRTAWCLEGARAALAMGWSVMWWSADPDELPQARLIQAAESLAPEAYPAWRFSWSSASSHSHNLALWQACDADHIARWMGQWLDRNARARGRRRLRTEQTDLERWVKAWVTHRDAQAQPAGELEAVRALMGAEHLAPCPCPEDIEQVLRAWAHVPALHSRPLADLGHVPWAQVSTRGAVAWWAVLGGLDSDGGQWARIAWDQWVADRHALQDPPWVLIIDETGQAVDPEALDTRAIVWQTQAVDAETLARWHDGLDQGTLFGEPAAFILGPYPAVTRWFPAAPLPTTVRQRSPAPAMPTRLPAWPVQAPWSVQWQAHQWERSLVAAKAPERRRL